MGHFDKVKTKISIILYVNLLPLFFTRTMRKYWLLMLRIMYQNPKQLVSRSCRSIAQSSATSRLSEVFVYIS